MNLLSGIVATITMAAAFALTGSDSNRYFSVALGIALSTTVISYLFVYPSLAKLRTSHPETPRPFRVPGGLGGRGSSAGSRRSGSSWARSR